MTAPRRTRVSVGVGVGLLVGLWAASFFLGAIWPAPLKACLLGRDLLRPDSTVCELALGGLWVSLSIGIAAGALSTLVGLLIAMAARVARGATEEVTLRFADAFFALPDVLVLMVLQLAAQTLGDLDPRWRLPPILLMILSLAAIGWAGPTRMIRNRLATLESQDFIAAARGLGASRVHLLGQHLWPAMRSYVLVLLVSRIPSAIVAESTVSFFGIAKVEPMSLGRYLGTSYAALLYPAGARVVLPAWLLLVSVVLGAALVARTQANEP